MAHTKQIQSEMYIKTLLSFLGMESHRSSMTALNWWVTNAHRQVLACVAKVGAWRHILHAIRHYTSGYQFSGSIRAAKVTLLCSYG